MPRRLTQLTRKTKRKAYSGRPLGTSFESQLLSLYFAGVLLGEISARVLNTRRRPDSLFIMLLVPINGIRELLEYYISISKNESTSKTTPEFESSAKTHVPPKIIDQNSAGTQLFCGLSTFTIFGKSGIYLLAHSAFSRTLRFAWALSESAPSARQRNDDVCTLESKNTDCCLHSSALTLYNSTTVFPPQKCSSSASRR